MISDKNFLEFISGNNSSLTKAEIESIIDKELEKSEDVMDADLIEYCLDSLNEMSETKDSINEEKKVGDTNAELVNLKFKKVSASAVAEVDTTSISNDKNVKVSIFRRSSMKKVVSFSICFVILALCSAIGINVINQTPTSNYDKVQYLQNSTQLIDLSSKEQYVGISDFVFVGRVEEIVATGEYDGEFHKNYFSLETSGMIYTEYKVTVLENIKGELSKDEAISVKKFAGVDKHSSTLCIQNGDIMPLEQEEYIFLTAVEIDGSLVIIDPIGNVPLSESADNPVKLDEITTEENSEQTTTTSGLLDTITTPTTSSNIEVTKYNKDEIIKSYKDAFENEVVPKYKEE